MEHVNRIKQYDLMEEVLANSELVNKLIKDDEFTINFYNTVSNSLWRKRGILSDFEIQMMNMCSFDSDKWRIKMSDLYNTIVKLRKDAGKLKTPAAETKFYKKVYVNDNTLETNQEIVDLLLSMDWEHHKYDRTFVYM